MSMRTPSSGSYGSCPPASSACLANSAVFVCSSASTKDVVSRIRLGQLVRSLLPAGGNLAGREPGRPAGRPGKTRRPKERYARLTDVKSCLDMHFRVMQSFNPQSINRPSPGRTRHGADACQIAILPARQRWPE